MDPDTINCVILRIHVDKNKIPTHAIKRWTSVSARYGSKKKYNLSWLEVEKAQFFRARPKLKLWVLRPDVPEPAKIVHGPPSSPSFLLLKISNFELFWKSGLSSLEPGSFRL